MAFQPDYHHMLDVLDNKRPERLPLYEHIISPSIMEKILNVQFATLANGNEVDKREFFTQYCRFFKEMTYDTVSFEVGIIDILPDSGAIMGGNPAQFKTEKILTSFPGMNCQNDIGNWPSQCLMRLLNACPME